LAGAQGSWDASLFKRGESVKRETKIAALIVLAALATGIPAGILAAQALYYLAVCITPVRPPVYKQPSCTLGVALEGVGTLRWRENVVVCKGPSGEPIVLSNMVQISAKGGLK
jgi:hypothetical protein